MEDFFFKSNHRDNLENIIKFDQMTKNFAIFSKMRQSISTNQLYIAALWYQPFWLFCLLWNFFILFFFCFCLFSKAWKSSSLLNHLNFFSESFFVIYIYKFCKKEIHPIRTSRTSSRWSSTKSRKFNIIISFFFFKSSIYIFLQVQFR